jgi:hypothetical protein
MKVSSLKLFDCFALDPAMASIFIDSPVAAVHPKGIRCEKPISKGHTIPEGTRDAHIVYIAHIEYIITWQRFCPVAYLRKTRLENHDNHHRFNRRKRLEQP